MRAALFLGVLALGAVGCGEGADAGDTGIDAALDEDARDAASSDVLSMFDAGGIDGSTIDGGTLDAAALDSGPTDALGLDALGLDALGLDALGLDALGLDALGLDAPSVDASGADAFGLDAPSRDTNDDIGSRLDRCAAGCAHLASCGLSSCASLGIDCATVDEERACTVDCLRGYACGDVSGIGFSNCSAACRAPVDAAYPDVYASDTRADSGSLSDRCSAGCDYLLGCGFSTCTTLGVDCSTPMENHACLADCLRGFACIDVPGVGFAYCTMACSSTLDAGPPTDAGPGPAACTSCAMSSCSSELTDCLADDGCEALALCVSTCSDTTCRDDCLARHAAPPALRDPMLSCLCTRCAGPCTRVDPCAIP